MTSKKADMIRLLEAELELIEGGGYGLPAGQPGAEKPMLYHSLVCINHWEVPDHDSECHDKCVLLDVVPEDRKAERLPCHFIPLNANGDTIHSLETAGEREAVQEQVKRWLRERIDKLKDSADDAIADVEY